MKKRMFVICAMLTFAAFCVSSYGQSSSVNMTKPNHSLLIAPSTPSSSTTPYLQPNVPATTGAGPIQVPSVPPAAVTTPSATGTGPIQQPGVPSAVGTQPNQVPSSISVQPGVPGAPTSGMGSMQVPAGIATGPSFASVPSSSVAVDNNYVYVTQGGRLYKYDKASVSNLGIPVPSPVTTGIYGATMACNCLVPSTPALSGAGASALACLQGLTCSDLDKAYLMAMINSQSSVIGISDVAAEYGSRTSVQDFAINAESNAKGIVSQFNSWLRTKFCTNVTVCPTPSPIGGFNICNPAINRGRELDITYANAAIQYYTDEIALSQYELANGADCEIKRAACEIIKADQDKIDVLRKWLCNT